MDHQDNIPQRLREVLKATHTYFFEYSPEKDIFTAFDEMLRPERVIKDFLPALEQSKQVADGDRWKMKEFFSGATQEPIEVSLIADDGADRRIRLTRSQADSAKPDIIEGLIHDETQEYTRERELERRAKYDALTGLYNREEGCSLIEDYLFSKNPYASCGLMVMDIDFFKNANDNFGHQFGDQVLVSFANLLSVMFRPSDVVMRLSGDEFVVFLKDIAHASLVKRVHQLTAAARELTFEEHDYSITCSIGVCYLPENVSGYTFDQLFKNADWALYRAKENGRNRYEFCDHLQRFEMVDDHAPARRDIDTRYLHGDIVSTAFEIFEKRSSFNEAIKLLLEIVGIRFSLDRITVIRTDIKEQNTARQHQWVSSRAPEALQTPGEFTKEDFLTLFNSYDEYGTTVLHYDDMGAYSPGAEALLMQGEAKTVLYAAMYCEGRYTGAISYVTCGAKRFWSKQDRERLGELTKIISAHLAKSLALNASNQRASFQPEYDSLTGLLSFHRFREEVERLIVGGFATKHIMLSGDFRSFSRINRDYGFSIGDSLLKEFSSKIASFIAARGESYLSRVAGDCFVMFTPYANLEDTVAEIRRFEQDFMKEWANRFPKMNPRIRIGIYAVEPTCMSASEAIDAADYARRQIPDEGDIFLQVYNSDMAHKQDIEEHLESQLDDALKRGHIRAYLQPRVSLADRALVGAEALVRWEQDDGTVLLPSEFLPLYENSGKVIELDLCIFEQIAAFLERFEAHHGRPLLISVNASILHATNPTSPEQYQAILEQHGVNPSRVQIELAKTDIASTISDVHQLFGCLQDKGFQTVMDDFGSREDAPADLLDAPVNVIKLGRTFLKICGKGERGAKLLAGIIELVKSLGFKVTCEGIETEAEAELLCNAGCDEGQGYLFSKPLSIDEFECFALEYPKA